MHIVCSKSGTASDVFPTIGLALELGRRGHSVVIATNANFESLAREYDIPFEALGSEADHITYAVHPGLGHPQRAFSFFQAVRNPSVIRFGYLPGTTFLAGALR